MQINDFLQFEKKAWKSGYLRVAGIDEVGRGSLAGPVVAAAVLFNKKFIEKNIHKTFIELTDSKKLSEKKRNKFYEILVSNESVEISLGIVEAKEIDKSNIQIATHKAMINASKKIKKDFILVDGLPVRGFDCNSTNIIKGDFLSISISAASVIAKVTRDRIMTEMNKSYPNYQFNKNKGYGTADHLRALKKYGISKIHRKTFKPVKDLI